MTHPPPPPRAIDRLSLPIALGVLAILVCARITWQMLASPLPDEAYYWLWGQRLDWSYYDHPPLQAWMQRAFHAIGAEGLWGLRASTLATTAVLVIALVLLVQPLARGPGRVAVVAGVLASPVVLVFTTITFPDHLMIALLALAAVVFVRMARNLECAEPAPTLLIYAGALCLGLAMLTKINAVLFAAGVLGGLIAWPAARPLWRNGHFYGALGLMVLCQAPTFGWNLANSGESYRYNLVARLTADPAQMASNAIGFVLLSLLALSPFLVPALVRFLKRPLPGALGLLAWWVFVVSGVFWLAMTALTPVLYYWILPAWVSLLPLLLLELRRKAALLAHLALGCLVAVLFTINGTVIPLSALFGPADHETSLLYGWDEVAPAVSAARAQTGAGFTLATDYRHGAIVAFHTGDRQVEVISPRRSQFDLWFDEDARDGQAAVIVSTEWHPMRPDIEARFASLRALSDHEIRRFGRPVARYRLWLGEGYIASSSAPGLPSVDSGAGQ